MGALEILAFASTMDSDSPEVLAPLVELAPAALISSEEFERQQQELFQSLHRMTQLYDLEKSFNATLELDPLMELIPAKSAASLPAQAIHLWLFDGPTLRLMASHGEDESVTVGMLQRPGEGHVADVAEEDSALLIDDPGDPLLAVRNALEVDTDPIQNALLVPLMQDESEVGVLEAVNRKGSSSFDEDDLFFS